VRDHDEHEDFDMNKNSIGALNAIAKRNGTMLDLMTHIAKHGPCDQTEHSFTALVTAYAKDNRRGNETTEQAFSRVFSAKDELGLALRKAHQTVKKGVAIFISEGIDSLAGGAAVSTSLGRRGALVRTVRYPNRTVGGPSNAGTRCLVGVPRQWG
jgi:hypothetical protein